jgi:prolyl 4-hydroxylase
MFGIRTIPDNRPRLPGPARCYSIARQRYRNKDMDGTDSALLPNDSGVASHVMAMRAGEGAGVPQSWEAALEHLQRSAEEGFALAQAEIAALAGEWDLSREIEGGRQLGKAEWPRLRRGISLSHWLAAPPKQIVSASPRIAAVDRLASPEICRWVIARASRNLSRATVFDPEGGDPRSEWVRTNSQCYFLRDESDLLLLFLRARIANIIELPVAWMEVPMVLHYAPGEEFLPHCDFLDATLPGPARDLAERGQRVVTLLLSLNEGYEGGETEFPDLQRRWKGRAGNALFFWNVEPDGTPDRRTVHAGLPPASGEKWLLSQWVRVPAAVARR